MGFQLRPKASCGQAVSLQPPTGHYIFPCNTACVLADDLHSQKERNFYKILHRHTYAHTHSHKSKPDLSQVEKLFNMTPCLMLLPPEWGQSVPGLLPSGLRSCWLRPTPVEPPSHPQKKKKRSVLPDSTHVEENDEKDVLKFCVHRISVVWSVASLLRPCLYF